MSGKSKPKVKATQRKAASKDRPHAKAGKRIVLNHFPHSRAGRPRIVEDMVGTPI